MKPAEIATFLRVTGKFTKLPAGSTAIDTTAKYGPWAMLSPFLLPGGDLYGGQHAINMENAWQFSKLYARHADPNGEPTTEYWRWAVAGWLDEKAHRYPMGKGARPLCSLWDGEHLGYVEARKRIYAPLYARAVVRTAAFAQLQQIFATKTSEQLSAERFTLYLRDYDGYDHVAQERSIRDILNDPTRKMGHAFVLWMLLTGYDEVGQFEASRYLQLP